MPPTAVPRCPRWSTDPTPTVSGAAALHHPLRRRLPGRAGRQPRAAAGSRSDAVKLKGWALRAAAVPAAAMAAHGPLALQRSNKHKCPEI